MINKKEKGFTLVELLAVIVILAIILVIAVPKVMSIIEDAKKGTLESTAKMIASSAEKAKVQNTVLGNTEEITCDSVAKINKVDYASCSVVFDNNTAKVTIEGKGKFEGLSICGGTKTSAEATKDGCLPQAKSLNVKHPLFLKGEKLTPDKFEVITTYSDGSTRELWAGGFKADETVEEKIITSPNWPENYPNDMTKEENYWEATYDGAEAIQITFDEMSKTRYSDDEKDYLVLYDKDGNEEYKLFGSNFAGKTYIITGDYIKVIMISNSWGTEKGFSATIKPANNVPAEYTISPNVAPNTDGNFDITITINGQNVSKKIIAEVGNHNVEDYVVSHKGFDTIQTNAEYNETIYDAGIRYIGELKDVNNKVYYNCDDTDRAGVSYGANNYDYASSCEIWRIIGVFNTKESIDGNVVSRVKLINTSSTFRASYDSSSGVNYGWGINQWGKSSYEDGTTYDGADLMKLLNGFYISESTSCTYCNNEGQATCEQTCTAESLKNANMKVLTNMAKEMIGTAVWDMYGVTSDLWPIISEYKNEVYLQEKGISAQYLCQVFRDQCYDGIERTTSWTGLVGLMSASDIVYADGWLYNNTYFPWTITKYVNYDYLSGLWVSDYYQVSANDGYELSGVWPSVYLKSGVKVTGGNGADEPYRLAM